MKVKKAMKAESKIFNQDIQNSFSLLLESWGNLTQIGANNGNEKLFLLSAYGS
jgi:hypothetical protein